MEIDSAIQSDVPNDTPAAAPNNEAGEAPKSPRELAMEAIANQHTQRMAQESGVSIDPDADPDADTSIVDPDAQINAQLSDDSPVAPATRPATVKVKIDGTEADVPLDEVVREFQKKGAADARLQEAARVKRELDQREAQLAAQQQQLLQMQQQLQQQLQQAPQHNTPPASDAPEEAGRDFLRALFEGDEEAALARLKDLTTGGRQAPAQPTLDIAQITQSVAQHVQQQLHVESALAQHRSDYPEIYADPDIEALVLAKVNGRRSESNADFFDTLNTVSQEFASKFGWNQQAQTTGRASGAGPTTSNSRAAKLEKKAQIDNVTSINSKTVNTDAAPENTSDVIAAMRRARAGG